MQPCVENRRVGDLGLYAEVVPPPPLVPGAFENHSLEPLTILPLDKERRPRVYDFPENTLGWQNRQTILAGARSAITDKQVEYCH